LLLINIAKHPSPNYLALSEQLMRVFACMPEGAEIL
jgi:hypothetical protein